jgi:hypothetical protein
MENVDQQKMEILRQRLLPSGSISSDLQALLDFLPACEYELISFMAAQTPTVWSGPVPPPPPNYQLGDGSVELGLFLFWINNPQYLTVTLSYFSWKDQIAILGLLFTLSELLAAPQMTDGNAAYFNNNELIYSDGSVLSVEKYATYDQGWFIAFLNLVLTVKDGLWYNGGNLPAAPPPPVQMTGANPNTVTIAILGDWGTGDATADGIKTSLMNKNPDYIVHVGDVYYSGTPSATSPNGDAYFDAGEEPGNLLALWPSAYAGKSFTLNSNHEMYSGANGYFYDALGVSGNGVSGTPFSAQKGSSFFALQYGGWTILGLDSAYLASPFDAFMTGSIGGPDGVQGQWIKGLQLKPENTIVLTHHNGFAFDASEGSTFWGEINGALNGDPYAWYWGHVHNGIAYDRPITIPPTSTEPGLTTNTFARCLGHAALPYGPSTDLASAPVAWYATNLQPSPSKQLYNGYAILTLTTNSENQLTGISESFYDLSQEGAVWTNTIYPVA